MPRVARVAVSQLSWARREQPCTARDGRAGTIDRPSTDRKRGLIVEVTDGEPDNYHDHLFYDLPKKSAMRLALAYSEELGPHGVTGIAISPGWLRSEWMLDRHGVDERNWQDWYWNDPGHRPASWLASQSPRYTGRAVVALATDPDVSRWNGQAVKTEQLSGVYGFFDVNGTRPGLGIYDCGHLEARRPRRDEYPCES